MRRLIRAIGMRRARVRTPVLVYHLTDPRPAESIFSGTIHNVVPDSLARQLEVLKDNFDVVPLDVLTERIRRGRSIKRMAAVTFDDGYRSVLEHAAPVLEALQIPSTFFISTKLLEGGTFWRDKVRFVIVKGFCDEFLDFARSRESAFEHVAADRFYRDTKNPAMISSSLVDRMLDSFLVETGRSLEKESAEAYCRPADLKACSSQYMSFGNHTSSHYVLSSLSREEQLDEIQSAARVLSDYGFDLSNVFAIPFGAPRDFTATTLELIRDLGFAGFVQSAGYRVVGGLDGVVANDFGLVGVNRFMPRPSVARVWKA